MNYNTKAEAVKWPSQFCYPTKGIWRADLGAAALLLNQAIELIDIYFIKAFAGAVVWELLLGRSAETGHGKLAQSEETRRGEVILAVNAGSNGGGTRRDRSSGNIRCRISACPDPSSDFQGQEPGNWLHIKECCPRFVESGFPMSGKIHGADADTTLLIDPIRRRSPARCKPDAAAMAAAIECELKAVAPTS